MTAIERTLNQKSWTCCDNHAHIYDCTSVSLRCIVKKRHAEVNNRYDSSFCHNGHPTAVFERLHPGDRVFLLQWESTSWLTVITEHNGKWWRGRSNWRAKTVKLESECNSSLHWQIKSERFWNHWVVTFWTRGDRCLWRVLFILLGRT